MLFTQRFNEILKTSGVKQSELAVHCNLTKQTISNFKAGISYPSIQSLYKICEYLDCSADYLLGLSDI